VEDAARRPSPHPQKGPRPSATSRATETWSTSAGSRLSLKNSTSGHIEVNLLGIDIHAIHSPWGQAVGLVDDDDVNFPGADLLQWPLQVRTVGHDRDDMVPLRRPLFSRLILLRTQPFYDRRGSRNEKVLHSGIQGILNKPCNSILGIANFLTERIDSDL